MSTEKTPYHVAPEHGAAERNAAMDMPEDVLRRAVDRLLERCGKEQAHWHPVPGTPQADMPDAYLHVSEILFLLGLRDLPLLKDSSVATWIQLVRSGEVKP